MIPEKNQRKSSVNDKLKGGGFCLKGQDECH